MEEDIKVLENMRDNIYGAIQFEDDYQVRITEQKEFDALNLAINHLRKTKEVTNLYLNTSSKLERLENKIKMRIEQLESEFKEHEEKGLNGLIQKLDCGTRIEALKDLLKD